MLLDEPSEGLAPVIVEQMADAVLRMKEEGIAVLVSEQNLDFAAAVADRALILEKGSVRWDLQQPNEIYVGRRDEPNQTLQRATPGFDADVAGFTDYPGGHAEGFSDAHKMHYRAVYEHIASGRKTPALFATAEDGHHEVKLCDAVLKSSTGHKWVKV